MHSTIVGTLAIILACSIWGLIFLLPMLITEFSPIEIALGRFAVFGIISMIVLTIYTLKGHPLWELRIWKRAFLYAFVANIVYYTALVMGMRLASPSVGALILGLCPVLIAFLGNWQLNECSYKVLVIPSTLIAIGIILVNLQAFDHEFNDSSLEYILGVFFDTIALCIWCWYAVSNVQFIRKESHIPRRIWSSMIGTATLICVILLWCASYFLPIDGLHDTPSEVPRDILVFWLVSLILGVFCSWVGICLWNFAGSILPISFAGQLMIFETGFGLLYVYLYEWKIPPYTEMLGILCMAAAIIYSSRIFIGTEATVTKKA